MKRIACLFSVLFLFVNLVRSQTEVGICHDLDGEPLIDYYDPMIYFPTSRLQEIHFWQVYELGCYYDSIGKRVEGIIGFDNSRVLFKTNSDNDSIKLVPAKVKYFVAGKDSFLAIKNYYVGKTMFIKPVYMQYIATLQGRVFVKYYDFEQFSEEKPASELFFVKEKGDSVWYNLSAKNRFKEMATKYFGYIPYLKEKITNGYYSSNDLTGIIKMCEYEEKYKRSEPVYYDRYWEEVKDSLKASYYAKIIGRADSIWTFDYYKNSTRLYQVKYSSFNPNIKNGELTCYFPNGRVRKIVSYQNNKADEVRIYNSVGAMKAHYHYEEKKHRLAKKEVVIRYLSVSDSSGSGDLKGNVRPRIDMFDKKSGLTYTGLYYNDVISSFYRVEGIDTIFQITKGGYDFKLKALQSDFHYFIGKQNLKSAIIGGAQGILLVKLLIDENGFVKRDELLNSIHPQIDTAVKRFVRHEFYEKAKRNFRFTPYERNQLNKQFEIILPCEILVNRFYRPPVNFNHFNDSQWNGNNNFMLQRQMMQQHMMQQHMIQQQMMMRQPMMGGMRTGF